VRNGAWDMAGWTVIAGGLFLAAWSTYGFETAVCYTGEFKDPKDRYVQGHLSTRDSYASWCTRWCRSRSRVTWGWATREARGARCAWPVVEPAIYGGMLAPDIYSGMASPASWREWCTSAARFGGRVRDRDADPRARAIAHDVDGRLFANALPGLRRRVAAKVSLEAESPRRAQ